MRQGRELCRRVAPRKDSECESFRLLRKIKLITRPFGEAGRHGPALLEKRTILFPCALYVSCG